MAEEGMDLDLDANGQGGMEFEGEGGWRGKVEMGVGPDEVELSSIRELISSILRGYQAENVMPESSRIVCLDSQLDIRQGFFVLLENGLASAPVWNSMHMKFLATITISDFIDFLFFANYASSHSLSEVYSARTIGAWLESTRDSRQWEWKHVNADTSLYDSCRVLRDHDLHYLPVYSRGENIVVQVLTHAKILSFLRENLSAEEFMTAHMKSGASNYNILECQVDSLGIGTFKDLATVGYSTPIVECLQTMTSRRLTELPVINGEGKFVDVFSKHDVFELYKGDSQSNKDLTVRETILRHRQTGSMKHCCRPQESLRIILNAFGRSKVERLYFVNDDNQLEGVLSLSDLLSFFIMT